MPRISTSPTLYEEVLQVRLSKLKELGFLKSNSCQSGTLTWSRRGEVTNSIGIKVDTRKAPSYVRLTYTWRGEDRNYLIPLITVPSNLGRGQVPYFLCPHTHKRCRILYFGGGYFLHREAFPGFMYERQTYSSHWRFLERAAALAFGCNKIYEELNSKYFKTHYAGKPTKRYLRLMKKLNQTDLATAERYEALLQ